MSMNTKELATALREIARTLPGGYAAQICSVSADRLEGQLEGYERLQASFGASQFERYKAEATRERYRVIGIEIENKRRQAERELDAFRRRTIGIEMPADIDTPKASD